MVSGGLSAEGHAMDSQPETLIVALATVQKQHQLLRDLHPVLHEVLWVLDAGEPLTNEQISSWQDRYLEMDRRLNELSEEIVALSQSADALFRYDA